ncbi:phosphotransferase [Raineyella antarctica]|nr:phosphotransferase [Raineyella antarctica]
MTEVIPYLRDRKLLGAASVVSGDVRVFDASRRNRNFKVLRSDGPSLFVKQGTLRAGFSAVRREAEVYGLLNGPEVGHPPYPHAPRFVGYDPDQDVLVIELLADTVDLRRHDTGRRTVPLRAAAALGAALAGLHALVPPSTAAARLGDGEPGVLTAHRPGLALLRDFSAASIELVRLIQSHAEVVAQLEDLRAGWRADALIHHDARWDNVLVGRGGRATTLIDWETAAVGDPAWDVGGVLADYLSQWLLSIPSTGSTPPEQALHLARRPLTTLQPAMAALWRAYRESARLSTAAGEELLRRTTRFAGLKLVQSAIEQVQNTPRWTVASLCQLQVGSNLMARPDEGSRLILIPEALA